MNQTRDPLSSTQAPAQGGAIPQPDALVPVPAPASLSAADRLALSREMLRQTMVDSSSCKSRRSRGKPGEAAQRSSLLDGLSAIPGADVVIDSVRHWWARHPMRLVAMVAGDATKGMLRPMARNNPLGLVAGAVVVGALVVWIRPWRRIIRPALFAGLLPQLVTCAMTKMPVEAWVSKVAGMVNKTAAPRNTARPQTPRTAPQQQPKPAAAPAPAARAASPAGSPTTAAPQRSAAVTTSTPKPARTLP